jgi:hypothetical protein
MMVIETILPVTFSVDCTLLNKHIQTDMYIYSMDNKSNTICCCHCSEEHYDPEGMLIYYIVN